jgi:hypothetical protein
VTRSGYVPPYREPRVHLRTGKALKPAPMERVECAPYGDYPWQLLRPCPTCGAKAGQPCIEFKDPAVYGHMTYPYHRTREEVRRK